MNAPIDIPFSAEPPKFRPGIVKRLSQRHRTLARMLAMGQSPGDCARILRYDPSRVSILQNDPAFIAMVDYYRGVKDEEFRQHAAKLSDLNETVIDELQERIEVAPEEFTPSQLTELLKVTADRTGLGPTSTVRHTHLAVTASDLDAIKSRLAGDQSGRVELVSIVDARAIDAPASDGQRPAAYAEAQGQAPTSGPSLSGNSEQSNSNEPPEGRSP